MKTRIVYPQLWLDEKFAECKQSTKLLFLYLITNNYLGLSIYTHLNDRQILFDTGLNSVQLEEGKKELESIRWVFFKDGWLFHNHKCAYVDYVRNEKVESAKQKEIITVPSELAQYFDEICLNKVQTEFKQRLHINHKPETINHKPETINQGGVGGKLVKDHKKEILGIPLEEKQKISDQYKVPLSFVESKADDLLNWHEENPKKNKKENYIATLRNWVKRDALKIKTTQHDKSKIRFIDPK